MSQIEINFEPWFDYEYDGNYADSLFCTEDVIPTDLKELAAFLEQIFKVYEEEFSRPNNFVILKNAMQKIMAYSKNYYSDQVFKHIADKFHALEHKIDRDFLFLKINYVAKYNEDRLLSFLEELKIESSEYSLYFPKKRDKILVLLEDLIKATQAENIVPQRYGADLWLIYYQEYAKLLSDLKELGDEKFLLINEFKKHESNVRFSLAAFISLQTMQTEIDSKEDFLKHLYGKKQ